MKKFLFLSPLILVIISTQLAQAQVENGCDPNAEWKNHGAYVSCVAKQKPGGQVVSEAAKSDVGKKNKDNNGAPTLTPTVSVSPTLSPEPTIEASPTPTEEITPTPTLTPTETPIPTTEPTPEEEFVNAGGTETNTLVRELIDTLKELIKSLKDLF